MTRGRRTAQIFVTLGGIVLLVATGAGWVTIDASRDVGGLTVGGSSSVSGTEFAPAALMAGVAALVLAALLAFRAVTVRRVTGGLAIAFGAVAGALVVNGISGAAGEGTLTAAPWAALAGAVVTAVGGVLAVRSPSQQHVTGRFEVPAEQRLDDEWEIASGEQL